MNNFDMPTMEGLIRQEETIDSTKNSHNPSNKHNTKFFNKTKLITAFVLFFIFILISVGLVVLSSKKAVPQDVQPGIVVATPQPQNTVIDSQTKELNEKLNTYDLKVDSLRNNIDNFQPPQIDIKVSF